jgi:hypothetical protein
MFRCVSVLYWSRFIADLRIQLMISTELHIMWSHTQYQALCYLLFWTIYSSLHVILSVT